MPTDEANPWDDPDEAPAPASPPADEPAATPTGAAATGPAPAAAGPSLAKDPGAVATEPAGDTGPTPDGERADVAPADDDQGGSGDDDRRRVVVIAAVAFVVIAVVAFVLTRGEDEDTPATGGGGTTGEQTAVGGQAGPTGGGGAVTIAGTADSFNRDDTDDGLGTLPSGAPWVVQSGSWAIRSGEAVVTQPEEGRRNAVYVATGYPDPQAQVRLTTVANGAGLVFRYQGECNFWTVYAVPQYATWNVEKVVDCALVGEEEGSQVYRTITGAPVGPGTTVGVVLQGDQVQIVLNGNAVLTFDDPDLAGVGRVGLTTRGDDEAAFDDFVAGGPEGQGVVAPTAEGEGEGGAPTTAADGAGG